LNNVELSVCRKNCRPQNDSDQGENAKLRFQAS
jgi:hypothetical protein